MNSSANQLSFVGNNQQQDLESESPAGRRYLQATVSVGPLPRRKTGPLKSTSFHVFLASLFLTGQNGGDSCCFIGGARGVLRRLQQFAESAQREASSEAAQSNRGLTLI